MSRCCHYCSLLLLSCSFGSLCVRFLPLPSTACSSTPVLLSLPSPFCKSDGMHSTCHFMNFVCTFLFSLCISCFTHHILQLFVIFLKICFPPSLGSMILEIELMQNHGTRTVSAPPIPRITPIFELFMAPGICQIGGKNVYFSFMCSLWRLCFPLCVLPHAFCMKFTHFRNAFAMILLQNRPCSRKSHRTNM